MPREEVLARSKSFFVSSEKDNARVMRPAGIRFWEEVRWFILTRNSRFERKLCRRRMKLLFIWKEISSLETPSCQMVSKAFSTFQKEESLAFRGVVCLESIMVRSNNIQVCIFFLETRAYASFGKFR